MELGFIGLRLRLQGSYLEAKMPLKKIVDLNPKPPDRGPLRAGPENC